MTSIARFRTLRRELSQTNESILWKRALAKLWNPYLWMQCGAPAAICIYGMQGMSENEVECALERIAHSGRLDIFQYMWNEKCDLIPWNNIKAFTKMIKGTILNACIGGHLKLIQHLHEVWNLPLSQDCWMAAEYGQWQVMLYLHSRRCPWYPNTLAQTACYGRHDVMKWLIDNGYANEVQDCQDALRRTKESDEKMKELLSSQLHIVQVRSQVADSSKVGCYPTSKLGPFKGYPRAKGTEDDIHIDRVLEYRVWVTTPTFSSSYKKHEQKTQCYCYAYRDNAYGCYRNLQQILTSDSMHSSIKVTINALVEQDFYYRRVRYNEMKGGVTYYRQASKKNTHNPKYDPTYERVEKSRRIELLWGLLFIQPKEWIPL